VWTENRDQILIRRRRSSDKITAKNANIASVFLLISFAYPISKTHLNIDRSKEVITEDGEGENVAEYPYYNKTKTFM
jgi:hypothetical protein